jgi:predicted dehydrogenase
MDRLSIGLVGCGGMGRRHLEALGALRGIGSDRFDLTAVCDPRLDLAEAAADLAEVRLGSRPAVFARQEDLIDSALVVAVDVVTDPSSHHRIAVPALDAGLHVICEKPLGITVRACRLIVDAALRSGSVLATAANYRRDGPNRLARAVIDSGLLGDLHLMIETNVGGDDRVIISPWRHLRESGSIALDMGVHYTDMFSYYLGELDTVYGAAFVAEPMRRLGDIGALPPGIEEVSPGFMRATGDDSLVALYRTASGVLIQLSYLPSGPGWHLTQRSLHGQFGSMRVPRDRSGGAVEVRLGERTLSGSELRKELGDFRLEGVSAAFFGAEGTEYDLEFPAVDAATIGIELDDFAMAIAGGLPPEVDGFGGLAAVAGVWGVAESLRCGRPVRVAEVAAGSISAAQDSVDEGLGLVKEDE